MKELEDSCLPFSAIYTFYTDFAASESSRLNRDTLQETVENVTGFKPVFTKQYSYQENKKPKQGRKGPTTQTQEPAKADPVEMDVNRKIKITYFDFLEIMFEISQEIYVSRSLTIAQKFRDYVEKVLIVNIKYLLSYVLLNSKDEEANLHKKRLLSELDRVRSSQMLRKAAKANMNDMSFIDLI